MIAQQTVNQRNNVIAKNDKLLANEINEKLVFYNNKKLIQQREVKNDLKTHCPRNFQLAGHTQEDNGEREVACNVNAALGTKSQGTSQVKTETNKKFQVQN